MIERAIADIAPLGALLLAGGSLGTLLWLLRAVLDEYGRQRVPCLLYHQIQPAPQTDGGPRTDPVYVCFANRFQEQMDDLKAGGWTTLTMDELMVARHEPHRLPERAVLVTFDDGFASNYELAFPVLRRNRQKATIFMTPDRSSHNFKAYAHLDRPLTDEELRELSEGGVDVQSHGLTHRFLTELDDVELRRELVQSRAILEKTTGRPVRYLAIPGGAYDRRVRRMAREAGYEAVFCMRKGSVGLKGDPYALPRMVVARDMTLEDFRSLLTPAGRLKGRIVSTLQEGMGRMLGMRRLDALRAFLYASPLAPLVRPRTIFWTILTCAALALVVLLWIVLAGAS
jgi:peptidoglycan/xylan/chitin deacetylase (PgdA/CDA1 family)